MTALCHGLFVLTASSIGLMLLDGGRESGLGTGRRLNHSNPRYLNEFTLSDRVGIVSGALDLVAKVDFASHAKKFLEDKFCNSVSLTRKGTRRSKQLLKPGADPAEAPRPFDGHQRYRGRKLPILSCRATVHSPDIGVVPRKAWKTLKVLKII